MDNLPFHAFEMFDNSAFNSVVNIGSAVSEYNSMIDRVIPPSMQKQLDTFSTFQSSPFASVPTIGDVIKNAGVGDVIKNAGIGDAIKNTEIGGAIKAAMIGNTAILRGAREALYGVEVGDSVKAFGNTQLLGSSAFENWCNGQSDHLQAFLSSYDWGAISRKTYACIYDENNLVSDEEFGEASDYIAETVNQTLILNENTCTIKESFFVFWIGVVDQIYLQIEYFKRELVKPNVIAVIEFVLTTIVACIIQNLWNTWYYPSSSLTANELRIELKAVKEELKQGGYNLYSVRVVKVKTSLRVHSNPKLKSPVVYRLRPAVAVQVIDTKGKMALILYRDPLSGDAISGWVAKKYLVKV
ncbi:SH3 domain-containing protein [Desulfovibrio sp. JC010]|uniref:SH3 domain-containing protein n=1 Tax=Desulfovibrio sp. JC010 TaxID=2593641 RepID=UPI0013D2B033|nr:SH3 domain-containing protein [Desulfovibrio sp. JC010]NDV27521.1 SH3 domain-containing protein [Desulfovibrio sp. JC010]